MLGEKTLQVEALSDQDLESLAKRLQPFLSGHNDDKRLASLEKELHRLAKEVYKLRLEMSETQPAPDFDR